MLDSNALQQLNQLKQSIREDKNLHSGTVRGSQGRFGFVTLEDGREAFLPPDEMARVFPGDRVEVSVTEAENKDASGKKVNASLDKLLESQTKTVIGQYVVRGKGHFVAIDMPQLNRWIFLPPKARAKAVEGDYIQCRITRHPFEDGKGQAKVVSIIGKQDEAGIEHKFTTTKHQLAVNWSKAVTQQVETLQQSATTQTKSDRYLNSPFVTIDSEATRDMDDALYIEEKADGWLLQIAIADPSSSIEAGSAIDKAALQRASTSYLPGGAVTMLPDTLANNTYSLVANEVRPALICSLEIGTDGQIDQAQFEFASIRSQHKLSYHAVSQFLEGDSEAVPVDIQAMITSLYKCSQALNRNRGAEMLLMEERDDYEFDLDDKKHIANINRVPRNKAQQIVEEAMLICNHRAGQFLAEHPGSGIFSSHPGFREERLDMVRELVSSDAPELAELDITSLDGYRQLIKSLQFHSDKADLLAVLRAQLQPSSLSSEAEPHMGLGMSHYATITSPIRRYADLHNHRAIRGILEGNAVAAPTSESLTAMQEGLQKTRAASRDLETWLYCLFLQNHRNKPLAGKIIRVASQGVSVKLDDWGIVGFAKLDSKVFKFNADRLTLTSEEQVLKLEQAITVEVSNIDLEKKRINFKLVKEAVEESAQ